MKLAICGPESCGKTTLANDLITRYNFILLNKEDGLPEDEDNYVIDGIQTYEEFHYLQSHGFVMLRIYQEGKSFLDKIQRPDLIKMNDSEGVWEIIFINDNPTLAKTQHVSDAIYRKYIQNQSKPDKV